MSTSSTNSKNKVRKVCQACLAKPATTCVTIGQHKELTLRSKFQTVYYQYLCNDCFQNLTRGSIVPGLGQVPHKPPVLVSAPPPIADQCTLQVTTPTTKQETLTSMPKITLLSITAITLVRGVQCLGSGILFSCSTGIIS